MDGWFYASNRLQGKKALNVMKTFPIIVFQFCNIVFKVEERVRKSLIIKMIQKKEKGRKKICRDVM